MASTNKTDNLGLNQWVKTDPVLMEDFNADNAKLDGEIYRLKGQMCFNKLKDITVDATNIAQIDIDVSDIDFSRYAKLWLTAGLRTGNSSITVYFRLNEAQSGYYGSQSYPPAYFNGTNDFFMSLLGSNSNSATTIDLTVSPGSGVSPSKALLIGHSFSVAQYLAGCYHALAPFNSLADIKTFNFICGSSTFYGACSFFIYGLLR